MNNPQPSPTTPGPTAASRPPAATTPPPLPPSRPASGVPNSVRADAKLPGWAFWQAAPSWLLSSIVHLAFILLLALVTLTDIHPRHVATIGATLVGGHDDSGDGLEESPLEPVDNSSGTAGTNLDELLKPNALTSTGDPSTDSTAPLLPSAPTIDSPLGAMSIGGGPGGGGMPDGLALGGLGDSIGKSLSGRTSAATRSRLVASGGGNDQSEAAVARALQWLSQHQNTDGSWHFDYAAAPQCNGQCDHSGVMPAEITSTAMALLPFLGAGETHLEGKYKQNVDKGLHFLIKAMGTDGSLWEPGGNMYGQGLASMALCEAYTMTRDPALREAAQKATDYNVAAQDQQGGGWRYRPGMPGDVSVFGWEFMAIKSASMAYLNVPDETFRKANYFLDSMQSDDGASYGYLMPDQGGIAMLGTGRATPPIGLLCRMYLGWKHNHPALVEGVRRLSIAGPRIGRDPGGAFEQTQVGPGFARRVRIRRPTGVNMYYNYYATQVMHHFGGEEWKKWNNEMRDFLIATQANQGHETGSWFFEGADMGGQIAGRLYFTSLSAMTLEVYYRHLPLYSDLSTKEPFQ